MTGFVTSYQNKFIDWFLRGQSFSHGPLTIASPAYTNLYLALFRNDGGFSDDTITCTEVPAGVGYARATIPCSMTSWSGTQGQGTTTPSSGGAGNYSYNNNTVTFGSGNTTGDWGTLGYWALMDAPTGGNVVMWGYLNDTPIPSGMPKPAFPANRLYIRFD